MLYHTKAKQYLTLPKLNITLQYPGDTSQYSTYATLNALHPTPQCFTGTQQNSTLLIITYAKRHDTLTAPYDTKPAPLLTAPGQYFTKLYNHFTIVGHNIHLTIHFPTLLRQNCIYVTVA